MVHMLPGVAPGYFPMEHMVPDLERTGQDAGRVSVH